MMTSHCINEDCVKVLFKKERTVIIVRCRGDEPDLVGKEACRGKLLLRLSLLSGSSKKTLLLVQEKGSLVKYSPSTIKLLSDYSHRLSKLRKNFMKLWTKQSFHDPRHYDPRCSYSCVLYRSVADCKDHLSFFDNIGLAYTNPLAFYDFLRLAFCEANKVRCRNRRCAKELKSLLASSLKEIEESQFILLSKNSHYVFENEIYKEIFQQQKVMKIALLDEYHKGFPIKSYEVDVFDIEIYDFQSSEHLYRVSLNLPYAAKYLSDMLIDSVGGEILDKMIRRDSLWYKICLLKDMFEDIVKTKGLVRGDDPLIKKVALFSAYRALGVHKLMPFLLDGHVDEVYLDKPGTKVYIDHEEVGRCVTNVTLTSKDVQRFINHVLLESKLPLSYLNPSLKWNLRLGDFIVRTSIDVPPLSHEGPSLDLRKLRHRVYTIVDLVLNNVLSLEEAAFLVLHVINRRNIIICGEPGTGKTTLMNALDLCTPKYWRKVYIEDVVESLDQRGQGRHQLRLYVEPFEVAEKTRKKSMEIIKLLHRTPDWVCLGELQSKEHFKALFHAVAAGLRGVHTCHASSASGLIRRLLLHCGISKEDLSGIDLIVHMVKCYRGSKILRRVAEVWAIGTLESTSTDPLDIPLSLIFKWSPERDLHKIILDDVFKSPSIFKLLGLGNSHNTLRREYEELKALFSSLTLSPPSDVEHFTKAFDDFLKKLTKEGVYAI